VWDLHLQINGPKETPANSQQYFLKHEGLTRRIENPKEETQMSLLGWTERFGSPDRYQACYFQLLISKLPTEGIFRAEKSGSRVYQSAGCR
jgi:hypothetical protein